MLTNLGRTTVLAIAMLTLCAGSSYGVLTAYYSYDNAGNLGQDTSGVGNNLASNAGGPTAFGAGKFGGAADFSGAGQMLTGAVTGLPVGNSAYTVSTWFNADTGGARGMVGWGNYGTNNTVNAFRTGGTTELHNYWWGNDLVVTGLPDLTSGAAPAGWHQAIATYDSATREHRIYLDGKQVGGRVANTLLNVANSNFAVGRTCTFCGGGEFFDGQLDDTAIFNNALAPNQIVALSTGATTANALPNASPLVGLYRFENAGSVGQDSSEVFNNLVAIGNAQQTASGKFGGGLLLDGNGDFLGVNAGGTGIPAGVPFGNSGYTISSWFKPTATTNPLGAQNGIIGWGDAGGNQTTDLRLAGDVFAGAQGFRHYWFGNDLDRSAGAVNLFDGQFHNVIAVYDPALNRRELFLDGVSIGFDNPGIHLATPTAFGLGKTLGNEFFFGTLDDVAIFNRPLSGAEMAAIRAGNFSAFLTPAVPEPTSAALLLIGGAALLRRRRAV